MVATAAADQPGPIVVARPGDAVAGAKLYGFGTVDLGSVLPPANSFSTAIASTAKLPVTTSVGSHRGDTRLPEQTLTDMVATLYEQQGPASIVLMAGDADYVPPLEKALDKDWRTEVAFIDPATLDDIHRLNW